MNRDLSDYRESYEQRQLIKKSLPKNPIQLFANWFDEADNSDFIREANAMTLSTLGVNGYPSSRIVLLKQFDDKGFVFYTNYNSNKGKAIINHPQVCLSFYWPDLERQVIVRGIASKVPDEVSDAYFNSRPKGSQLGAIASNQSNVIESRDFLDDCLKSLELEYENKEVSRPKHWGGFIVAANQIEFWQGRKNRLHDRFLFTKNDDDWLIDRLSP